MTEATVTNNTSGTNVTEIADGIYRISTPLPPSEFPGGFSFNQFLIKDERPLLFHTGLKQLFPVVRQAVETILPIQSLRYVSFSHYEADECGALNEFLEVAPDAVPLCGQVAAMVSVGDIAIRPPQALADGESVSLGTHSVQWFDTPHLPHAWECGFLFEQHTRTLLCGDLFTQPGHECPPVTEADILESSEAFRQQMDYFSHTPATLSMMERLAATEPTTLACMHGSAWKGDGGALLRKLAQRLTA